METSVLRPERDSILNLSLHKITKHHERGAEMGLIERLEADIQTTDWSETERDSLRTAIDTMLVVHEGQKRGKHPYSTHVLRVSNRLLSASHFNIRDDPNIIIASLLHDTVEDSPTRLIDNPDLRSEDETENQLTAIRAIQQKFGTDVAVLVAELTNPVMPSKLKGDDKKPERNVFYQKHVRELLDSTSAARYIKLSDFIDNCVGLIHNECGKRAGKLATKYYPLIEDFRTFVDSAELDDDVKQHLYNQLDRAVTRCEEFMPQAA